MNRLAVGGALLALVAPVLAAGSFDSPPAAEPREILTGATSLDQALAKTRGVPAR